MSLSIRRFIGRLIRLLLWRRVADQPIPQLVVHLMLQSGDRTVARSLVQSQGGLARGGVAWVGDLEEAPTSRPDVRAALVTCRVRRPVRAAIVSTDRGMVGFTLGDGNDVIALCPDLEGSLRGLIEELAADRVAIVLDLPRPDRLLGDAITGLVESGGSLPTTLTVTSDLYRDLEERLSALEGVGEVVVEVGDEPNVAARVERVASMAGVGLRSIPRMRPRARPAWTLRGVIAASEVNPHLDLSERALVHGAIRSLTSSGPTRPPQALAPCPVRRALDPSVHVSGCGTTGIRELHLHVGLQKTATTTVQRAMKAARQELRAAGVVYVNRTDMMRLGDLRAWGAYSQSGLSFDSFAAQLQALVKRHQHLGEAAGFPNDVVFISNETFVGAMERGPFLERPFRPRAERALTEILDILQPESCHLSLVTRRQDTLIESMYMWQLHGGEWFDFDRYLTGILRHPDALSYTGLAGRLENIPGVDSLLVHPFETIRLDLGGFLNRLLVPMGVTIDFESLTFRQRANPAFSERAMLLAKAISPHLDAKAEVATLRRFLRTTFPLGEDYPGTVLLSEDDRLEVLRSQASDNEQLFRRWMPAYPADAYARLDTVEMLR